MANHFKVIAQPNGRGRLAINGVEVQDVRSVSFNLTADKMTTIHVEIYGSLELEADIERDGTAITTAVMIADPLIGS